MLFATSAIAIGKSVPTGDTRRHRPRKARNSGPVGVALAPLLMDPPIPGLGVTTDAS
jgi:hypothetical protein